MTIIDIAGRPNGAYTKIEILGDVKAPDLSGTVYRRLPSMYTAEQGWTGTSGSGDAAFWQRAHSVPVQGEKTRWGHLSTNME